MPVEEGMAIVHGEEKISRKAAKPERFKGWEAKELRNTQYDGRDEILLIRLLRLMLRSVADLPIAKSKGARRRDLPATYRVNRDALPWPY